MRRGLAGGVLVMVAAAAVGVLGGTPTQEARAGETRNGLIAVARSDPAAVLVVGPGGTGLRTLVGPTKKAVYSSLAWSPDGSTLAFLCWQPGDDEPALCLIGAAGGTPTRVVIGGGLTAAGSLTWLPDGRRLGFTAATRSGGSAASRHDIYVMDADGGNLRALAHTRNIVETGVDWSPAGGRIVIAAGGWFSKLYVANADGSGLRTLTPARGFEAAEPDWSPDGRRIAFTRNAGYRSAEIYVTDIGGAQRVRLTRNGVFDRQPAWSPDGRKIAFVSYRGWENGRFGRSWIFLMNADGSDRTRLVPGGSPAWQPAVS